MLDPCMDIPTGAEEIGKIMCRRSTDFKNVLHGFEGRCQPGVEVATAEEIVGEIMCRGRDNVA